MGARSHQQSGVGTKHYGTCRAAVVSSVAPVAVPLVGLMQREKVARHRRPASSGHQYPKGGPYGGEKRFKHTSTPGGLMVERADWPVQKNAPVPLRALWW